MATKATKATSFATSYPSMVSNERAFNLSEFAFFGFKGDKPLFDLTLERDAVPVTLRREVFCSNNSAAATKEEDRGKPNPQAIDFAVLPPDTDTLLISGTIVAHGSGVDLHSCNSPDFAQAYKDFAQSFIDAGGMRTLAERYLMNMVNGALLFRNRLGVDIRCAVRARDITVEIHENDLDSVCSLNMSAVKDAAKRKLLEQLADMLAVALSGQGKAMLFEVRCSAVMGEGQEVYPSQEFLLEVIESKSSAGSNRGYKDGRYLARALRNDGVVQVAYHARKASNALRTIDTWWPGATRALPVEPYGVDRSTQSAKRNNDSDFYGIVMTMPAMTQELQQKQVSDNALFTMAVFLRGGVFSKSNKTKTEDASAGAEG